MVKVNFGRIQVNAVAFEGAEIIFPYSDKWYKMKWEYVPDRFKQLYVLKLRLLGNTVPETLQQYIVNNIDVENLDVELDLTNAQEIDESYPL